MIGIQPAARVNTCMHWFNLLQSHTAPSNMCQCVIGNDCVHAHVYGHQPCVWHNISVLELFDILFLLILIVIHASACTYL